MKTLKIFFFVLFVLAFSPPVLTQDVGIDGDGEGG